MAEVAQVTIKSTAFIFISTSATPTFRPFYRTEKCLDRELTDKRGDSNREAVSNFAAALAFALFPLMATRDATNQARASLKPRRKNANIYPDTAAAFETAFTVTADIERPFPRPTATNTSSTQQNHHHCCGAMWWSVGWCA